MKSKNTENIRIDELISDYFAQGLESSDLAELHNWLTSANENKAYFLQKQEIWFSAIGANNEFRFDKEKAFQRFLARVESTSKVSKHSLKPERRIVFYLRRIAAAVALLIVFGGSGYWIGNNGFGTQLKEVSVEAPFGSRTKLFLPDGSMVWLNAGSILTYSHGFGFKDRNVKLNGEAYFEVTKNKNLPFQVKTDEMKVRVLGTKFNFRNYRNEDEAKVSLLEGKVIANSGLNGTTQRSLAPNQQIVLDKKTGNTRITFVNAKRAKLWTKGLICFDEEKLPDIAKELERSYNVKITIADDSLRNLRFYGNFTRNEQTVHEVLDVLASTNKIRYKIEGKSITLSLR